jgi:urease accessory protein
VIRVSAYADQTQRRPAEVVLEIVLPYDLRKKSRLHTHSRCGKEVGIFLERGNILKAGDELRAESGELIRIVAADEAVSTATCDDFMLLLKGAYHLGNRHVPLQIGALQTGALQTGPLQIGKQQKYWLRYQPDYVLDDMLVQMGLSVAQEQAPFHPESGAYGSAANITPANFKIIQSHSHHGHAHEHDHSHGHSHSHTHGHGHHHHG